MCLYVCAGMIRCISKSGLLLGPTRIVNPILSIRLSPIPSYYSILKVKITTSTIYQFLCLFCLYVFIFIYLYICLPVLCVAILVASTASSNCFGNNFIMYMQFLYLFHHLWAIISLARHNYLFFICSVLDDMCAFFVCFL